MLTNAYTHTLRHRQTHTHTYRKHLLARCLIKYLTYLLTMEKKINITHTITMKENPCNKAPVQWKAWRWLFHNTTYLRKALGNRRHTHDLLCSQGMSNDSSGHNRLNRISEMKKTRITHTSATPGGYAVTGNDSMLVNTVVSDIAGLPSASTSL